MKYYKRSWEETTGDALTDNRGYSTYYFETDDAGNVIRQLQVFAAGNALKYDLDYPEDKFGGLSSERLDEIEFKPFLIHAGEFEALWDEIEYRKYPEIIFTDDISWGQPRLDGRRLVVGDIISLAWINNSPYTFIDEYELSIQQVKQAIYYCRSMQCVSDKVSRFCYNCTLRVKQEGVSEGDEEDNWKRADHLYRQFFKS